MMPIGLIVSWFLAAEAIQHIIVLNHMVAMILGMVLLYAIRWGYYKLRGREGLGLGDIKLAGVAGAWTGLEGINYVILIACALAFMTILTRHIFGKLKIKSSTPIPLGTFLAPAIWIVWVLQKNMMM